MIPQRMVLSGLMLVSVLAGFAPAKIGIFDKSVDVGNPKLAGSASYDSKMKVYTIKGAGYNIWFERDEFQYLFKELKGDFTVTADFELVGKGTDPHRKVGWMVRESMADNASHISGVVHGDGLTVLQWRVAKGEKMRDPEDEIFSKEKMFRLSKCHEKEKYIPCLLQERARRCNLLERMKWETCPTKCWWVYTYVRTIRALPRKQRSGMFVFSYPNSNVYGCQRIGQDWLDTANRLTGKSRNETFFPEPTHCLSFSSRFGTLVPNP